MTFEDLRTWADGCSARMDVAARRMREFKFLPGAMAAAARENAEDDWREASAELFVAEDRMRRMRDK